jgi:hypothetical protein
MFWVGLGVGIVSTILIGGYAVARWLDKAFRL